MRKLNDVIDQLLIVSNDEDLNNELEGIKRSIPFTAPENMQIRWTQTHEALDDSINSPISDESVTLLSIFSTKPEEEIRSYFQ